MSHVWQFSQSVLATWQLEVGGQLSSVQSCAGKQPACGSAGMPQPGVSHRHDGSATQSPTVARYVHGSGSGGLQMMVESTVQMAPSQLAVAGISPHSESTV